MKSTSLFVAAVVCASVNCALAQSASPTLQHAALRMISNFTRAWHAGDAQALAQNFAPDADFIGPDGTRASGRRAIRAFYSSAFAHGYAGSRSTGDIRFVRKVAPDLAIVDAHWRIEGAKRTDGSPRASETGILVAMLRKRGEHWSILALRENEGASDIQTFASR